MSSQETMLDRMKEESLITLPSPILLVGAPGRPRPTWLFFLFFGFSGYEVGYRFDIKVVTYENTAVREVAALFWTPWERVWGIAAVRNDEPSRGPVVIAESVYEVRVANGMLR